MSVTVVETH